LKLSKCAFGDIERIAHAGEGESFVVDKCMYGGRLVAVKHIKLQSVQGDHAAFSRRLESILLEIQIMHHSPLHNHPNILELLGYGWKSQGNNPLPYVIVEYSSHGSLRSHLRSQPIHSLRKKAINGGDVAAGLMALHACGIVHGDLKLDNVLVFPSWDRPSGTVAKLCDFGHSILLTGDNERKRRYYGTSL
jgi:serine/threonine protein kinase